MKTKLLLMVLIASLLICAFSVCAFAKQEDEIVILYENDVHCVIEGYSSLSALKNELKQEYEHVGVVTSGDFLQGSSLGSVSKGEYIVRLMNLVGYDAIALGNHEFDFGLERLFELAQMLDTKPVCANFKSISEGECFEPYSIVSYGDTKIAYIGITTPTTPTTTSYPSQFVDENKNPLYTFSADDLAAVLQENIDDAREAGADYVIALSHLGDTSTEYKASDLVSDTVGLDAVLDAHSHTVIESQTLLDKDGNEVVYTSTGTKFANVGKLTISASGITSELISLDEYTTTDPAVDACIDQIMTEYATVGDKKIGECSSDLITHDSEGNRIIRIHETNLGNLISDAFRYVLGADIAYFNGGAIRSDIKKGKITYNELLNVLPFNNTGVVVEASGQTIVEMLELSVSKWPEESAAYPHVSGIIFSVNVLGNENEKVYNVMVWNSETETYEPIDLERTYTVASSSFVLLEGGDGMTMFEDAKVVSDTGILDIEILESYIVEHLDGIIDDNYRLVKTHISFTEGEVSGFDPYADDGDHAVWIAVIGIILAATTMIIVFTIRKRRG